MISHKSFVYLMEKKEQELNDIRKANLHLAERLRKEERSKNNFLLELLGIEFPENGDIMGVFTEKFKITVLLRSGKELVYRMVKDEKD